MDYFESCLFSNSNAVFFFEYSFFSRFLRLCTFKIREEMGDDIIVELQKQIPKYLNIYLYCKFTSIREISQYAHDVVLKSVRRRFNVVDVVWTSKRRRVLTRLVNIKICKNFRERSFKYSAYPGGRYLFKGSFTFIPCQKFAPKFHNPTNQAQSHRVFTTRIYFILMHIDGT